VIEPASAQPVLGTVSPGRRDLAGGEEMTSLAALIIIVLHAR
jgi:hypothetical protein